MALNKCFIIIIIIIIIIINALLYIALNCDAHCEMYE